MIAFSLATVAAVVVPKFAAPVAHPGPLDALLRTLLVVVAAATFLFGPGLALIFYGRLPSGRGLGVALLPGGAALVIAGLVAWLLSPWVHPTATCRVLLGLLSVGLFLLAAASLFRTGEVPRADRVAIVVVLCVVLLGAGRNLYSLGPPGELLAGTVSRTYEATIVPDSRISFHVVQLIASGSPPHGAESTRLFSPYDFSSRGPLAGIATAPLVLTAGARVPLAPPNQPWQPFDQQGFAAYRLSMEVFAAFLLLSLYGLLRSLVPARAALFGLVLAASTPFVVHETYFTWPKLLAAGMVVLAAQQLLHRHYVRSGLLVGVGYLLHPVAIFAMPGLALLALIMDGRPVLDRAAARRVLGLVLLIASLGVVVVFWQLINLGHNQQSGFVEYAFQADGKPTNLIGWVDWRLQELADAVVPFHQALANSMAQYTWPPGHLPPKSVRLFLGYWGTLPLGIGILFYPVFLLGMAKALVRHPYVTTACVLVPFFAFLAYWGSYNLGLMAVGLQAWALGAIAVYAWARAHPGWWPVGLERWVLVARIPEVGLMIVFPGAWGSRRLLSAGYPLTDAAALAMIGVGLIGLLYFVWTLVGRQGTDSPARMEGALAEPDGVAS